MSVQPKDEIRNQPANLTIAQAIANYKAKAATPTFCLKDMVGAVIAEGGKKITLENDSYPDALEYTEAMLFNTHRSFNIVSGGGCGCFYATLLGHLTGALERVKYANGQARMIVMAAHYPEWLVALAYEFAGTFTQLNKLLKRNCGSMVFHIWT